ncbi:hypothetical protein [Sphingomonas koreensis]|jgi:hypothetical protein
MVNKMILSFKNQFEDSLTVRIEPTGDEYELPPLANLGLRHVSKENDSTRAICIMFEGRVEIWCDSDNYEIDIVYPSAFDRLSRDICVRGGWCGGVVDGARTTVDDLLPASGRITARDFAQLVIKADGGDELEKHLHWLEEKFIEFLGASSVDVSDLQRNLAQPFEDR